MESVSVDPDLRKLYQKCLTKICSIEFTGIHLVLSSIPDSFICDVIGCYWNDGLLDRLLESFTLVWYHFFSFVVL